MHQSIQVERVDLRSIFKITRNSYKPKKLVGFDMYPPHVHIIPEQMDSSCSGQTCFQPREEDFDRGSALSEESLAEAEALERKDAASAFGEMAADYFNLPFRILTPLDSCRPSLMLDLEPLYPGLLILGSDSTNSNTSSSA
jgi:hypothetical protein